MRVLSRADLGDSRWDAFVEKHPLGWFWHTSHWIRYSLAYTLGATDLSFAVTTTPGRIVAVVPLVKGPDGALVMGGQVTPAPLLDVVNMDVAIIAQGYAQDQLGRPPLPIQLRPGIIPETLPPHGVRAHYGSTYVVDLRRSEQQLWSGLRKSYKALIHKSERTYFSSVHAKAWAVEAAHDIHYSCAGRETRSSETWRLMQDWVEQGHALVALATDAECDKRSAVSYIYAIRYKTAAYYASGSSVKKDLAHLLQWETMKALRCGDIAMYELGHAAGPGSTEKDQGIAHFKAGFGGKPIPVVVVAPESWRPM